MWNICIPCWFNKGESKTYYFCLEILHLYWADLCVTLILWQLIIFCWKFAEKYLKQIWSNIYQIFLTESMLNMFQNIFWSILSIAETFLNYWNKLLKTVWNMNGKCWVQSETFWQILKRSETLQYQLMLIYNHSIHQCNQPTMDVIM